MDPDRIDEPVGHLCLEKTQKSVQEAHSESFQKTTGESLMGLNDADPGKRLENDTMRKRRRSTMAVEFEGDLDDLQRPNWFRSNLFYSSLTPSWQVDFAEVLLLHFFGSLAGVAINA